ncbi:YitT family protein [Bosea sp. TWI1241]|jgi:uncharacterized membrane-anchored protein YitT (DUF2179 family)|uniref:YitT family protein n=1 Tax=Bosea sp. TWI1241 TaxID=3148904 RepID=UPI00320AA0AD
MSDSSQPLPVEHHRLYEDAFAVVVGTLMMSLGVALYAQAGLVTGGAAGIALLIQAATGLSFGPVFFAINLPFYWLAVRRMGRGFTLRTLLAVSLVSLMTWATPHLLHIARIDTLYAAVAGGLLMGLGMLVLLRHRTGIGGLNILAAYLQERHGIRAGWFQLAVDGAILAAALTVLPPAQVLLSLVGAVALNVSLAVNHKPGRYLGVT